MSSDRARIFHIRRIRNLGELLGKVATMRTQIILFVTWVSIFNAIVNKKISLMKGTFKASKIG